MRIFLTGATGFVGSHLLPMLLERKHIVAVLIRPDRTFECLHHDKKQVTVIYGCLEEVNDFADALIDFSPNAVLHLGWLGVANQHHGSIDQLKNLQGSLALLKIAHRSGVKHWIALGSQAEYGIHNQVIDETASTLPTTTYGAIKLATLMACKELAGHYGMRFVWLRLFSCYGPGDDGDWFVPFIIKAMLKKKSPDMTAGEQLWDYLFIRDVVTAICKTVEIPTAEGVFNLGSGQPRSIRDVAEYVRDLIDPSIKLNLGAVPYKENQIMHMEADISRLSEATGWMPHSTLEQGLNETVGWYLEKP